ncbi:MAG: hypothetical protein IH898_07065 [Planctomycetes bacterium]|nr:hypothetical protein [Planctomycetota bacterium]
MNVGGGTLNTAGLVMLPGSSLLALVPSTVTTGTLLASSATTIDATGSDMTLGDASAVNGFASAGTMHVGNSTVTLLDANDAVFDSLALVTLGDGLGDAGTLGAANGLSLNLGGNITGFGTVDTPNNAATPFINNGNITGISLAEPVTLTGYLKGVGTYDNCNITGTDAFEFSTAAYNRGSVSYNGTLEIEIGGTTPGSGYDQLNHILGAGIAELGGTLDVLLIGGYVPSLGDTFDILTATGGVNGTFASTLFPDLGALLAMDLFYDTNTVTLAVVPALPGDFDIDGDVDGNDFLLWQRGGSPDPLSQSDLADWEANYGFVAPLSATSAAVPEPATGIIAMLIGMMALHFRRDLIVP